MLSSTTKVTCKCSQILNGCRRLSLSASLTLQPHKKSALELRFTRFISGSRSAASLETAASNPGIHQAPPPLSSQGTNKLKWDLYAGVVLERKPLITQEMIPIEKEYSELLAKYEFEMSKKSDHEVRKEKDKIIMEKIKSGEMESDQATASTAQDQEDLWAAELQQFVLASRKTEADKKDDQKSLERALDSYLLLVIEQKIGNGYKWICPHGKWIEGESMRQTADRTMNEVCPDIKAKVLGNAPWGIYKYKYPKMTTKNTNSVGAKVFFYKAQVVSGPSEVPKKSDPKKDPASPGIEVKDYLWLKREELESKLHPMYHKSILEFLVDEKN